MKIGIVIQCGPSCKASNSAYNFIKAALEDGHAIQGVFFNNDGVFNVINKRLKNNDDYWRWSELGANGIDIIACLSSAKDRGINSDIIVPNVRFSGFGQLTDIISKSDRLITFDS